MNYVMERISDIEFQWEIKADDADDLFVKALDRAIEKCESNPMICRLTLIVTPAFALKQNDVLQDRTFSVSGTVTADARIQIRYTKIVRRSTDGGRPAGNPVQHLVSPQEQNAIAENVARADAILQRFSGAPDRGAQ